MAMLLDVPADLQEVQEYLVRFMGRVQDRLAEQLGSDLPPVQRLVEHVERYHGKMIRPALVALCGLASREAPDRNNGQAADLSAAHTTVAGVCELIHLATLVHDDVLDEADTRRRTDTVNRLAGNETAVILGDYLFSSAYHLCSQLESQESSLLIAKVGMTLCAGELLQLHHREDFSLDEPTYFEIIERKTASLIGAACRLGARLSGADRETVHRFEQFGLRVGVAFQIQDDLLDLTGDQATVGKSVGKDVEKGKLTLPLIHHLATASPVQRGRTLMLLRERGVDTAERSAVLQAAMAATGSIDHARLTAESLVNQARAALGPLADSPAKRMLLLMADTVVTRSY